MGGGGDLAFNTFSLYQRYKIMLNKALVVLRVVGVSPKIHFGGFRYICL